MIKDIYKQHLIELYSERKNFGELKNKTHQVKFKNPVCNDEIIIDLCIKNRKIIDAKFRGITCFISTVSAEAILENIKGKKISEIKKLSKRDVDNFLGTEIISTRIPCELMPLEALKKLNDS